MELHPAVCKASDVPIYAKAYPNATTDEWCAYCGEEVVIPSYRESTCPNCGAPILPCSMCDACWVLDRSSLTHCPYE